MNNPFVNNDPLPTLNKYDLLESLNDSISSSDDPVEDEDTVEINTDNIKAEEQTLNYWEPPDYVAPKHVPCSTERDKHSTTKNKKSQKHSQPRKHQVLNTHITADNEVRS
ncbi:unnamed protein product [Didymodactylos carnosus]|uniref:Uncharacterized protein n=1 Tax=Didymodactylos carnosus TaxID=1234261 RepID=A0A814TQ58_9BILA|nr:unnamed protein product [Didymodactylos carnosus]CAF3927929.1 unnamed protein product [Didymodactylos carnosus]